jgi:tetratricopeptide (TPR) repeat protein
VSSKSKHKDSVLVLPLGVLRQRVERALVEGRFQNGLELARGLLRRDPVETNLELLRKACLGRARQLRLQGHLREACTVLGNAAELSSSPAYQADVAQELALCGEVGRALQIAQSLGDPTVEGKILAQVGDAAVVQGAAGRASLPEAMRAQFDLVLRGFTLVAEGKDHLTREALQGLGLQSPFLEWKLLLRGLVAYYQNDDVRAIETWQRLNSERWPARLAAPLRFLIDRDFRALQPPATQITLQKQADRLQSSGLVPLLRSLQAALANERQLPQAFRQAETLLETLRREAPGLVPRLASCFYWTVVHHGNPEDVRRYKLVFGSPADDRELTRLQALALEQRGMMQEAHELWQQYEKTIADTPAAWPGEQAKRARALIWWHMGHNADEMPDVEALPELPPFMRGKAGIPRPLKPTAEACFQRSIELAPDQLEPYLALLRHFMKKDQPSKAEKSARRLLKQFPDHAPTLEMLGDLRMLAQEYTEGVHCYEQALKGNPLERGLRSKLSGAHTFNARAHAEGGRFEQARAEYQAALSLGEAWSNYSVLCKWAACEFKAGDHPRAEELLDKALQDKGSHLAVAFSMLIEAIRLKLPVPLKKRFDRDVARLLAEPPTPEAAAAIALTVALHRRAGVTYHGQKTHEKKVLTYLEKARKLSFGERHLSEICLALADLDRSRLLRDYTRLGRRQHPSSPLFLITEARFNLGLGPYRCPVGQTQMLLKKAQDLAMALPRDQRQELLLEQIQEMEEELRQLNPLNNLFGGEMPFDPFDSFDDDDDYV